MRGKEIVARLCCPRGGVRARRLRRNQCEFFNLEWSGEMTYFVTGATGFIGRHLLEKLLLRKGRIYCLVRKESLPKFNDLCARLGAGKDRLIAVTGDLGKTRLGVTPTVLKNLDGKITHFFHLAALYDFAADESSQVPPTSKARAMPCSSPRRSRRDVSPHQFDCRRRRIPAFSRGHVR
jgi:hypothetical protein